MIFCQIYNCGFNFHVAVTGEGHSASQQQSLLPAMGLQLLVYVVAIWDAVPAV